MPGRAGDTVLDHIANHLHRIQVRTVGRRRQQMNARGHGVKRGPGMRACLIPDRHTPAGSTPGSRPAGTQTPPHAARPRPARCRDSPLILGLMRRRGPHAAQGPAPPRHRDQPVAMLIGHPYVHPPSTSHVQVLKLYAERPLKLGAGGRVFVRVSLVRHLQDSAQFSQPAIRAEIPSGLHRGFVPGDLRHDQAPAVAQRRPP